MPRRSKYGPSITYDGPFFEKDIRKTFRQNARDLVEAIAEDGERMVRSELPRSVDAPHYTDFVEGRAKSLKGKRWLVTAVVSGTLHLQAKNHKGYGRVIETDESFQRRQRQGVVTVRGQGRWIFRRVAQALRRGSKAARADLTKGLN